MLPLLEATEIPLEEMIEGAIEGELGPGAGNGSFPGP